MPTTDTTTLNWTKQYAGYYTLDGTEYGVSATYDTQASDGHEERTGRMLVAATEWAAVEGAKPGDHLSGSNLDWFDTMREAKAYIERRVAREAQQVTS